MALTWEQTLEEERKRKEAEFKVNMNNMLPGINNPVINPQNFVLKKDVEMDKSPNTINATNTTKAQNPIIENKRLDRIGTQPTSNYISNNSTGDVFTLNADNSISGTKPLKEIGRMGGYKLDGSRIVPSGNQGDQDALKNMSMLSTREEQHRQWLERQGYRPESEIVKNLLKPGDLPGMNNMDLREYNSRILATMDPNQKERNRINEMDVIGQNKLRDIQGQVAQSPPIKQLDDTYGTIDTFDELGNKTGQKIYNKATGQITEANQTTFAIPKPATTAKLLKMRASKDPNFAAAETEYKSRFGSLPY